MLQEFIVANRGEIVERVRQRAGAKAGEARVDTKQAQAIPMLLTQIVDALAEASSLRVLRTESPTTEIRDSAAIHGQQMLRDGFTVTQVVNSYGDLCQVVTQLAGERNAVISSRDFHTFNRCLDEAMAGAVTAHAKQRERDLAYEGTERIGVLVHEMRNLLNTMSLSFAIIREGKVGLGGTTGAMLARSMAGLCTLVDRSLAEVRLEAGGLKLEPISLPQFIEEMQINGAVHAEGYGVQLTVHPVDRDLMIDGDWQLLSSAVSNLLQNAFKFSRPHGHVSLVSRVSENRVLIEIGDECGGLPPGKIQELFRPFTQASADRSGLGLGLSIAQNAARANGGEIRVRDIPGKGCVFTVDLPRRVEPRPQAV
jgi:signal transduction histidine kinase